MRRGALIVLALAVGFGLVTVVALEGTEVVVLHTDDGAGNRHTTRTWVAEADGALLVEAANPERPFLRDLQRNPAVEMDRGGRRLTCRGFVLPDPEGHRKIRELLAKRYGWADRWIALVADTHASSAVRLECH